MYFYILYINIKSKLRYILITWSKIAYISIIGGGA